MEKREKSLLFTITALILLTIIPLISAQYGYGYYGSPVDYLDNEWVLFSAIFVTFFAIIYFSINKTIDNNPVSAVIALGVSVIIAAAIARRSLIYGYLGDQIGSWVLVIVLALISIVVISIIAKVFGAPGTIITATAIWFVLKFSDPYSILPYVGTNTFIMYEWITSIIGLVVLWMLAFFIGAISKKKSESVWEKLKDVFK